MQRYKNLIGLLIILFADVAWLSYYSSDIFDKTSPLLMVFISTRVGIWLIARQMRKATGNWLYIIFTAAYLFFSFAVASLYYLSSNAAAAY